MSPRGHFPEAPGLVPGPTRFGSQPSGAETFAPDRSYTRIYWIGGGNNSTNNPKTFPYEGDHLTITKVVGAAVWVRLNQKNSFIEVREGDVLIRDFNEVTFYTLANAVTGTGQKQVAEVEAYVSTGPLLVRAPKTYGVRGRPYMKMMTVGVNGISIPDLLAQNTPSFFKWGGELLIKNTDPGNTLYLVWRQAGIPIIGAPPVTNPAVPSEQFPLAPGEWIVIRFDDRAQQFIDANGAIITGLGGGQPVTGLVVAPFAGTCAFAIFASSLDQDLGDAESIVSPVPQPY